jgi:hypothetical protein
MTATAKYNKVIIGLIPGIIIPVITFIGFYIFKSRVSSIIDYVKLTIEMDLLSNVLSLCALPNLIIFFIFLSKNYYYSARGVIFATFMWAIIVVIARYFI